MYYQKTMPHGNRYQTLSNNYGFHKLGEK